MEVSERWESGRRRSDFPLAAPVHALITVGNVEEKVLFVMLLKKNKKRNKNHLRVYLI